MLLPAKVLSVFHPRPGSVPVLLERIVLVIVVDVVPAAIPAPKVPDPLDAIVQFRTDKVPLLALIPPP